MNNTSLISPTSSTHFIAILPITSLYDSNKMSTKTSDIFTIRAAPGTDIWRKPPTTNIYNGIYNLLSTPNLHPFLTFLQPSLTPSSTNRHPPLHPLHRPSDLLPLRPRLLLFPMARALRPSWDPPRFSSSPPFFIFFFFFDSLCYFGIREEERHPAQMDQNRHRILPIPTATEHSSHGKLG